MQVVNRMMPPQLVVVYGTLRKGNGNYRHLLEDQLCLGEFKTEPKYTMLSNGGFPMVFLNGDTRIVCEVFQINEQHVLNNLDNLEGYPTFYNRLEIDTPWGKGWMYYIEGDIKEQCRGRVLIESGDWNKFMKIELKEIVNG